jgi:hypothetical protein
MCVGKRFCDYGVYFSDLSAIEEGKELCIDFKL